MSTTTDTELLEKVRALHKPVKRWTHPEWLGSFDTEEEAADYDDGDAGRVGHFEVCEECGRVETEQLSEAGDGDWSYRESLWPCRTGVALGSAS